MKFLKYDLTNVGVIGDIHASLTNLNNILNLIDYKNRRKVISVGDIWDRGLEPNEIIDLLYDLYTTNKLIPIIGNHDNKFLRYFANPNKIQLGEQQKATLALLKEESITKFKEIFSEDIVSIYDPIRKIMISHAPGGRPYKILYKNYESLVIQIGGQRALTFEEFLLKDNHLVDKKHISTLLYGITRGDKTPEGFPVRLPITNSETDDLDGWKYIYGHIHATNFYPEVNTRLMCLDFNSPTGKIGGAIVNEDITLVV
jgi:hypothetical protein